MHYVGLVIPTTSKKLKSKENPARDAVAAGMVSRKKVVENSTKSNNHPWRMTFLEV